MADQLATPSDLASYLKQDLDLSTATLLVECATAVVQQAAGGQRIVQVVGDTVTILGVSDSWLDPPQRPATAVTSVTLDGTALTLGTGYKVFGNRLWRAQGWQSNIGWPWDWQWGDWRPSTVPAGYPVQEPSGVVVVYTHGYAAGSQDLQLARSAVLSLAAGVYNGTPGAASESIDDYSVTYEAMAAKMDTSPFLKAALSKKYGRRVGLARVG